MVMRSYFTQLKRCLPFLALSILTGSFHPVSNASNDKTEYSVSPAGDVNGDGLADVIVSVFVSEYGICKAGNAFLYYGTKNGVSALPVWTGTCNQVEANYGASVAYAGDINGDGYADVIVGAPHFSNGQSNEGAAFVYYGSPTGLSKTPSWTAESNQANAFFGESVSTAGDVNKDGYSDIIIGAPMFDNGETNEGRAFVYYGSANGISIMAAWTAEGDQVSANFGKTVACAGDVNGDNYSDVLVGAPNYDNGQINEGRAFIYSGTNIGVNLAPSWTGESNQAEANYGNALARAGDVNGDGFGDIVIGANRYDDGQSNVGKIYVYLGSANGFSLYPDWTFTGDQLDGNLGISVSGGGDINGDGYHEIVVGSSSSWQDRPNGKVYIFNGSRRGVTLDITQINNESFPNATLGYSVATAGDINGDGYADVIAGVILDTVQISAPGKAMMINGSSKGLMTATQNIAPL
jgi:FG-GAP repeat/FG-GAP-like repeat